MRFFHRTTAAAAEEILRSGFRDSEGTYLTELVWRGVWVSDEPLDESDGAPHGSILLVIECALDAEYFADYEWIEEGKPYREWLVPAAVLNERCAIRRAPLDA